jgi:hypothetical protein
LGYTKVIEGWHYRELERRPPLPSLRVAVSRNSGYSIAKLLLPVAAGRKPYTTIGSQNLCRLVVGRELIEG